MIRDGIVTRRKAAALYAELTRPRPGGFGAVFDGMGKVIDVGSTVDLLVPTALTLTGVKLLADDDGDIVIDIRASLAYPPSPADSIVGATPPSLSGAKHSHDVSLVDWNRELDADTHIRLSVTSVALIKRCFVIIEGTRQVRS